MSLFIDRAGKFFKDKLVKKMKKEQRLRKREAEIERRQIILETQGQAGLRKYLSDNNPTAKKKTSRKKTRKSFGKNKKRR